MYKHFSLQDDTGQGSKFFKLLDNLIGEHQALHKQRDLLAKANMELQQRLTSSGQGKYCMSGIPEDVQVDKSSMQGHVWASKEKVTPLSGQIEHSDIDVGETLRNLDESQINTPHTALQQCLPSRETALSQNSVSVVGESKMWYAHAADKSGQVPGDGVQKVAKGEGGMSGSNVARSIRLQARLGVGSENEILTPERLHHSLTNLGLMKFDLAEIKALMKALKQVLHPGEYQPRQSANSPARPSLARVFTPLSLQRTTLRLFGIEMQYSQTTEVERDCDMLFKEFSLLLLQPSTAAVPLDEHQTLLTIREVLVSAEANKLVAELTNVRIDDLASPPPTKDLLTQIEPLVNFMILANGIVVGIQTDSKDDSWVGWLFIEIVFVAFFTFETSLRMYIQGLRSYFGGGDSGWNLFDTGVISISIVDLSLSLAYTANDSQMPLTLFRLIRLLRLSRMMRLLRFKSAQELALMIRGLMGGFRTLCWATVMLVFAIYVIAVLVRSLVKNRKDIPSDTADLLSSVTGAMFTSFRCFTGDCTDKRGDSIPIVLEDKLGTYFVLGYCLCVMMVTFGIFNIIIAIYIENTLEAAKFQEQLDKKARDKEALRIAHLTKSLLKKFCQASKFFQDGVNASASDSRTARGFAKYMKHEEDVGIDTFQLTVSKDVFLLVIQDHAVQNIMDQLDLPHDRAALFDVLDADGNGSLEVTELVHGFLKVRGEARRSDSVAALLSVRVVQQMLRELRFDFTRYTSSMMSALPYLKHNHPVFGHRLGDDDNTADSRSPVPGDEDAAAPMMLSRASTRPRIQDWARERPPLVD